MDEGSPRSSSRSSLAVVVGTLVLLVLAPDVDLGPYDALNPLRLVRIAAAVLAITGAGHLAQKALGRRDGLVLSGFVAGFVSSTATIAAMGARAKREPELLRAAVAAATASNVATLLEYFVIVAAVEPTLVGSLLPPFGGALVVAVVVALGFARRAPRLERTPPAPGAFRSAPALLVAAGSGLLSVVASAMQDAIGESGPIVASAVAGLVDAHATTGGLATLMHGAHVSESTAVFAIVVAFSSNGISKIAMAVIPGGRDFAIRVSAGVLALVASSWIGLGIERLF